MSLKVAKIINIRTIASPMRNPILGALRQRPPTNRLDSIEQKVTAIE